MRVLLIITAALLATSPTFARGAHPLATDDTGTQGYRRFQLELTAEHGRNASTVADLRRVDLTGEAAVALSVGLGDSVDLVVGLPTAWGRSRLDGALVAEQAGLSDSAVEVKWRCFERGGLSAAVKPGITLPTGEPRDGLGTGRPGYGLTVIASLETGPIALHANGGWSRTDFALSEDAAASRRDRWSASLAAVAEVAPRLRLVTDLGVASPAERGASPWPAFAIAGAVWSPREAFDLDVGVRVGLDEAETDATILAGAAWRL